MDFRDELKMFLTAELTRTGSALEFKDSDSLFIAGRLDSVAAVRLLLFLEAREGSDPGAAVDDLSQIDSVDKILALLQK